MSSITLKRELPADFLSDILITAFDGRYGASWSWFEPAKKDWLVTEPPSPEYAHEDGSLGIDDLWMSVNVRLTEECETGIASIDAISKGKAGFLIDHDALATGIQRILDDDYVDVWKPATTTDIKYREQGIIEDKDWRWNSGRWERCTGETARGYRDDLAKIISGLDRGDTDAGDIDAPFADAIVQVATFGKVIFG